MAKWLDKYAMGGALPGATGMMYARTQDPAPSNGPYAKKTLASAQSGKNIPTTAGKVYHAEVNDEPIFNDPLTKLHTLPTTADSTRLYNSQMALNKFYENEMKAGKIRKSGTDSMGSKITSNVLMESLNKKLRQDNLNFYRGLIGMRKDMKGGSTWDDIYKELFNMSPEQIRQLENKGLGQTKSSSEYQEYYRDLVTPLQNLASPFALVDKRIAPQRLIHYEPGEKHLNYPGGSVSVYDYDPILIKPVNMLTPEERAFRIKKYGKDSGIKETVSKPIQKPVSKPTPKPEPEPTPVVEQQPVTTPIQQPTPQPKQLYNYDDGDYIMAPTPGGGGGAMVGVKKKDGTIEYVKPEDYKRMGVPKYGQDYIKAKQKMQKGGVIKDDRGQWAYPGEITEIGSNDITMQGVDYPVLGVSDTGDTQMMYPNQDYKFDGEKVTEFPMAQDGKKLKNVKGESEKFLKGWMDSPMYNKMINASINASPFQQEEIIKAISREDQLNKVSWQFSDLDADKSWLDKLSSPTLGEFKQDKNKIFLNPNSNDKFYETAVHELSHATDLAGANIPWADVEKMWKYQKLHQKEKGKITKFFDDEDFNTYVGRPTETRARLNAIRYLGKKEGIYDPYTEKVNKDILKKLPSSIVKPTQLDQLKLIYSDDQIIDLLNSVSKNDSNKLIPQAQDGGWLDKYQPEPMRQDATRNVVPRKMTDKERLEAVATSDQAQKKALNTAKEVITERQKNKATKGDLNTPGSWNIKEKARLFPSSVGGAGEMFDEYVNPATYVGILGDALGESVAARDPKGIATSLGLSALAGGLGLDPLGSGIKAVKTLTKQLPNAAKYTAGSMYKTYNENIYPILNKEKLAPYADKIAKLNEINAATKESLKSGELRKRLINQGLTEEEVSNMKVPNLAFFADNKSPGTSYGRYQDVNNLHKLEGININFDQLDRLKNRMTLTPEAAYEHEVGHFLQRPLADKNPLNDLNKYNESLKNYKKDVRIYKKEGKNLSNTFGLNKNKISKGDERERMRFLSRAMKEKDEAAVNWFDRKPQLPERPNYESELDKKVRDLNFNNENSFSNYFNKDHEAYPFLREMRQTMVDEGFIKDKYQDINKDAISNFLNSKTKNRLKEALNRKERESNTDMLHTLLKTLPAVAPAVVASQSQKKKNGGWLNKYK